jgi:hypothetical protein
MQGKLGRLRDGGEDSFMMTSLDSRKLRKEIARKYELDPKGWRFLWNAEERGRYNLLIAKDSRLWWLKEEMINPMLTVGCGVRSPLETDVRRRIFGTGYTDPSYGFRPIEEEHMKRIIIDLADGKTPSRSLSEVLNSEPKALKELDTSFVMQGPFHQMATLNDLLSDEQRKLDARLDAELEKLVLKRYPQLTMPYT